MQRISCGECGFVDDFDPDEFGTTYYQVVGECPSPGCPGVMQYEDGSPVKVELTVRATKDQKADKLIREGILKGCHKKRTTYRSLRDVVTDWRDQAESARALIERFQGEDENEVQYWLGSAQRWEQCADEIEDIIGKDEDNAGNNETNPNRSTQGGQTQPS